MLQSFEILSTISLLTSPKSNVKKNLLYLSLHYFTLNMLLALVYVCVHLWLFVYACAEVPGGEI